MRSARLTYRRPDKSDRDLLHGLDNDPEVMRWINGGLPVSLEVFESKLFPVYFENSVLRANGGVTGFWILESEAGFIGWISLRNTEPGEASLGYRLAQYSWGNGFATEAARFIVSRAFRDESLARVIATTYEKNSGSRRVLEKSGFRLVRRFRLDDAQSDTSVQSGETWDGDDLLYEILNPGLAKTGATS